MSRVIETVTGAQLVFTATGTSTAVGAGTVFKPPQRHRSFDVTITGTASISLQFSNNPAAASTPSTVDWKTYKTSSSSEGYALSDPWVWLRYNLASIATTGTNSVVVYMGA